MYILKLAEPGEVFQVQPAHAVLEPKAAWPAHDRAVTSVLFADDGNTLISASKDGFVKLWNAASGKEQSKVAAQEDGVHALARAADGKTLATAGFDGVIRLWDPKGNQLHELAGHQAGTAALLFIVGGEQLLSGGADGKVRFWSVKDGKPTCQLDASTDGITHLSLSKSGKTLATSGKDQTVRLWNVDTKMLRTCMPDGTAACFAPDGNHLAVATHSGTVEVRDTTTGEVRTRLRGHTDTPDRLCFSTDGERLVSCGADRGLYFWDAPRGHLLAVLRGCQGRPICVALSADGKTVAAGTEDGQLLLWSATRLGLASEMSRKTERQEPVYSQGSLH